jgi:hypothetical protein
MRIATSRVQAKNLLDFVGHSSGYRPRPLKLLGLLSWAAIPLPTRFTVVSNPAPARRVALAVSPRARLWNLALRKLRKPKTT